MTRKVAYWILLLGTVSSAIVFLAATWDTHRQVAVLSNVDKLSDRVVAGKAAFQKYNCNDCHTILGFGSYYAPDLTRVHTRIGEGGIRRRLLEPHVALAGSYRLMPRQDVTEPEVPQLLAFFRWVDGIDNHDWQPQDS